MGDHEGACPTSVNYAGFNLKSLLWKAGGQITNMLA